MKLQVKKLFLGAVLALCCLGMARGVGAEAKALDYQNLYKRSYVHSMSNEFALKQAYFYNDGEQPANSWGEIVLVYTSGEDGSSTSYRYLGDLKRGKGLEGLFQVKRKLETRRDGQEKELLSQTEKTDFTLVLEPQDEESLQLQNGKGSKVLPKDALGTYHSSLAYAEMSPEAAQYVLERCLENSPQYASMLQGAGIMYTGRPTGGSHSFKVVEHHPDHVVTRGEFQVTNTGLVLLWDVVGDRWQFLTD